MNAVESNGNGDFNGSSHPNDGITDAPVNGKTGNGNSSRTANGPGANLPPLPHITSNIIPLSNVLKFYCQESFKQLSTMIENLSMTRGKENDVMRKKKFLNLLVNLRKDFVKIYTLVKWASKSNEVAKLIDILNWLRTQEFYFEQLSLGLNELNGFSGAKLPNGDLTTSLEVLTKGRPQLPTYNYFPTDKLTTEKVIRVLEDINLVLTTRLALNDDTPVEMLKNHSISDGKLKFVLEKKYEVTVTVGDDLIAELEDEYSKSPYFIINFRFLFGIDTENILRTDIPTTLPVEFWRKLEAECNAALLTSNLRGLYDLLNKFTKHFKFNLIYQQLKDSKLLQFSQIKYKLQNNKILINYWNNPLNNIEISIADDFSIDFTWFKNNQEITKTDITVNNNEFNIELLINSILNKHCENLMHDISRTVKFCRLINPFQILIRLSDTKSTILSIDSLTGNFYFLEPGFVETSIINKINQYASNGALESALLEVIGKRLTELKLESIAREIRNRIITIEWISNRIITLKEQELAKLGQTTGPFKIQFFKCKNWPSSWFLINLINDKFEMNWFVSRIKSIKGEWKLEWVSDLQLGDAELDFEFFNGLSNVCSNKIIDSMISHELEIKNLKFFEITDTNKIYKAFKLDTIPKNNGYELKLLVHNNGEYLPVQTSSNTLVLVVQLMQNTIRATLRTKLSSRIEESDKLTLNNIQIVEQDSQRFLQVQEERKLVDNKLDLDLSIIDDTFKSLRTFNSSLKLLSELAENNVTVLEFDNAIKARINDVFDEVYIHLMSNLVDEEDLGSSYIYLKYPETAAFDVKMVINFLNKDLCYKGERSLVEVVNYMNYVAPSLEALRSFKSYLIKKDTFVLPNGLHKLYFDLKMVSLNNFQLLFGLNHLNPQNNKKIYKDKIIVNIKSKLNKFKYKDRLEINVSLIDNINIKNLKYKKLFELMLKNSSGNDKVVNLNYDFIVDPTAFSDFLIGIGNCFLSYIETDN